MKILFFVQFFHPSTEIGARRPSGMGRYFIAHGHSVDVLSANEIPVPPDLTSTAWRLLKKLKGWLLPQRTPQVPITRTSLARRVDATAAAPGAVATLRRWYVSLEALYCGLKMWTLRCIPAAIGQMKRGQYDVVINSCPPMNTALAMWLVRPFTKKGFLWVIDLRDPFSTPTLPHDRSRLRAALERWAERRCLRKCDLIVVASPGLAKDLAKRLPSVAAKLKVVYNGYDGEPKFSPPPPGNTLRLLSAGTIYFNRDPRPLFDAIKLAISRRRLSAQAFHLTLLGNCENPSRETILQWIAERGLAQAIELQSAVPAAEVEAYVRSSHVLVNFAQGQQMLIPAKTYEYMASGRETITITEPGSETASVVRATACGPCVLPDVETLTVTLIDLYERYIERREPFSPRVAAISEFSRKRQNERMLGLLLSLKR